MANLLSLVSLNAGNIPCCKGAKRDILMTRVKKSMVENLTLKINKQQQQQQKKPVKQKLDYPFTNLLPKPKLLIYVQT